MKMAFGSQKPPFFSEVNVVECHLMPERLVKGALGVSWEMGREMAVLGPKSSFFASRAPPRTPLAAPDPAVRLSADYTHPSGPQEPS